MRLTIIASRGCSKNKFTKAFPWVDRNEIRRSGDWHWFLDYGPKMNQGQCLHALSALAGPALMAHLSGTADGLLWLMRRGETPTTLCYGQGGMLEAGPELRASGEEQEDDEWVDDWDVLAGSSAMRPPRGPRETADAMVDTWAAMGVVGTEALSQSLSTVAQEDVAACVAEWQTSALAGALVRYGFFPNTDAALRALHGDSARDPLSPWGADCLLAVPAAVGIRGVGRAILDADAGIDVAEAEAAMRRSIADGFPDGDEDEWDEEEWDGDEALDLGEGPGDVETADVPAVVPISGGPVAIPFRRWHHLITAAQWCLDDVLPAIVIEDPESMVDISELARRHPCQVVDQPGGAAVYADPNWLVAPDARGFRRDFHRMVPDGATVTVGAERDPFDETSGMAVRGRREGESWVLEEAYPPVSHEELREAMALLDRLYDDEPIALRGEDERARLNEAIAAHPLYRLVVPPVRSLAFQGLRGERMMVVESLLRLRMVSAWNIAPRSDEEDENLAFLVSLGDQDRTPPLMGDAITTELGITLYEVDVPACPAETRGVVDKAVALAEGVGLTPLGVAIRPTGDVGWSLLLCAFLDPDAHTYVTGTVLSGVFVDWELRTQLADGRLIVTTSDTETRSLWENDMVCQSLPWLELAGLWGCHQSLVGRRVARGAAIRSWEPTLAVLGQESGRPVPGVLDW